jgi:hypothetical protein
MYMVENPLIEKKSDSSILSDKPTHEAWLWVKR